MRHAYDLDHDVIFSLKMYSRGIVIEFLFTVILI